MKWDIKGSMYSNWLYDCPFTSLATLLCRESEFGVSDTNVF